MRWIFTEEDRFCEDEYQSGTWLSEETGWWFPNGTVLIWTRGLSRRQQIGIAVHESVEYIMIHKLRMRGNGSHWIANCLEFIASLGAADLSWKPQEWKQ